MNIQICSKRGANCADGVLESSHRGTRPAFTSTTSIKTSGRFFVRSDHKQPTGSSNTMEVRLGILGKVKVDDYIDRLDVNAPGEEIYGKN